jgi:hypothetical protein
VDANAADLEASILALLDAAAAGATIGPADAVQAVVANRALRPGALTPDAAARAAALRLAAAGKVEILVGARVVEPSTARGEIRIRRVRT